MENNNPVSVQEEKPKQTKAEKIIVFVLALLFVSVLAGAFWDLSGKNLLTGYLCNSESIVSSTSLQKTDKLSEVDKTGSPTPPQNTENSVSYSTYSQCLENTKDLASSKDCCDCLDGDASVHKACRDRAATYDFSKNTLFKTFEIPSTLGQNGNYSECTESNNQQDCKKCCENSGKFVCGDFRFCRTACDNLSQ